MCMVSILLVSFTYISTTAANVGGLVTRRNLSQNKADNALLLLKGVLDYSEFKHVEMVIEVSSSPFDLLYSANLLETLFCLHSPINNFTF